METCYMARHMEPAQPGAPEAVLDWGGGGGGQRPKGAHDFFSVGAHQWRSQLFGMGGAPNVATIFF